MAAKVVAIVGSYRQGGTIDTAVEAILEGAREKGAETEVVQLRDAHVEFCRNCRICTQQPGAERGTCPIEDDMDRILRELESADVVVLGSPVNYWNVTAIFRRFMERLLGFAYWPWGNPGPMLRKTVPTRKAVLVASSAAPGFLIPLMTGAARALRTTAAMLGAKPVARLWIGLAGKQPDQPISPKVLEHARKIGMKLAQAEL